MFNNVVPCVYKLDNYFDDIIFTEILKIKIIYLINLNLILF